MILHRCEMWKAGNVVLTRRNRYTPSCGLGGKTNAYALWVAFVRKLAKATGSSGTGMKRVWNGYVVSGIDLSEKLCRKTWRK